MLKRNLHTNLSLWAIVFMGILYLLLPSINSSGDTYVYAYLIREGEELFMPHHLLYNAFFYIPVKLFGISNTLGFVCVMNGLFAVGCLAFTNAILTKFTDDKSRALLLILLGSCFGFMRYASTGETYILPLFFSLWASFSALNKQPVFLTALIAAVACLFHQIHFFWWLGLLAFIMAAYKENRLKHFVLYGAASCIVPIAYLLVFYLTKNDASSVFEFVVHDYVHREEVEFSLKTKSLLLTPINFVRTFYQVHGYIMPLLHKYWITGVFMAFSVIIGVIGCIKLRLVSIKKTDDEFYRRFGKYHLVIFVLQLLFAFISDGNAEFMVMLPFALVLFLFAACRPKRLPLTAFAFSLLIWNLSVGLIPSHLLELTPEPAMARYIEKHPADVYYITDKQPVEMNLLYHFPDRQYQLYKVRDDTSELDSLMLHHPRVLTNLFTPKVMSRSSIVGPAPRLSSYKSHPVAIIPYDLGVLTVSEIFSN